MADADRVGLAYVEESTYGEVPSGPPTLIDLRFTGETFGQNTTTVQSTEIRSDRQVVDLERTNVQASGDLNFELSYNAYDDFLNAALLSSAWSSVVTETDVDHSMANSDNSINRAAGSYITDGFLVNQWIRVSGFTGNLSNNTYFKIVSVAALKMVLSGSVVEDDTAGESVTIKMGPQIVNGTTLKSFSIERTYTDLTNIFALLTGMSIDTMSLNVTADQLITGSFGFIGQDEASAAATAGDGSNTAAPSGGVLNGVDGVKAIMEGQAAYPSTNLSFSIGNNLRSRLQIGTLGAISLGTGKINVTGAIQAYFNTVAVMDKYLNMTETSLAVVVEDIDAPGDAYVFDFPRIKYTDGKRVAGGENTDIIADMAFTAYRHATEAITVRIARFGA